MLLSQKASRLFKLRSLRGSKGVREDVELQPLKPLERRPQSDLPAAEVASEPLRQSRRVAGRAGATPTFGKRKKARMGQNAILIHEDNDVQARSGQKLRKMESRRQLGLVPDEEDELQEMEGEETSSEASIETEEDVDESVAEDMRKLEESFKGISTKYRLMNRIGEGKFG